MPVSNYLKFFKKKHAKYKTNYFPFLFQLKSKHDYYNNDNIRLLMTFEIGFKIFRIHMSLRK